MKIDLEKISAEPCRWRDCESIPVAELDRPELVALGDVNAEGEIVATETGFLLRVQIEYRQTLECTRCLRPIELPMAIETTLLVEVGGRPSMDPELELRQEDLNTLILENTILDTRPILVEQLQLNIPMRRLCRDDCPGLCSSCGADLSRGNCDCDAGPMDVRWSALAALQSSVDK